MERPPDVEIIGYDSDTGVDVWGRSVEQLIVSSKRKGKINFNDSRIIYLPESLLRHKKVKCIQFFKCQIQENDWEEGPFSHSELFEDLSRSNIKLKEVLISQCNLRTLPCRLFDIETLEAIHIQNVPTLRMKPKQPNNHVFPPPIELIIQDSIPPRLKLKELSLTDCGLKTIPHALSSLVSLQLVNISGNPGIKELPQFLKTFKGLKHLDASNCGLMEFPAVVCDIPSLLHLNLDKNIKMKSIPDSLQQLIRLQFLSLSSCGLGSFPMVILSLKGLHQLNLSGNNQVKKIHPGINDLVHLEHLAIAKCGLTEYPEVLSMMPELTHLDIGGNRFNSLHCPDLTMLRSLEHLEMGNCPFQGQHTTEQVLSHLLSKVQHLSLQGQQSSDAFPVQHLDLSHCNISSVPDQIRYLTNLHKLNLCGNGGLNSLPRSIIYLQRLEELELARCGFQAYPDVVSKLTDLRRLNLSGNEGIGFLPWSVERLQNLEHLNISECSFATFPDVVCRLGALLHLNVSGNELHSLPESLQCLKNLHMSG